MNEPLESATTGGRIRIGVIGVGYLGRFHAQKYAAMEDVTLVGVVDADRKRADDIAASVGTEAYTDYRDLFGRVDGVSIVVPTPFHHRVGRAFLEQGADVMIEKPITDSLKDAEDLITLADASRRLIQVGHLERYNPALVGVRDQIRPPRFIEARRVNPFTPRGTDVSVVLDLMIHDIDMVLDVVSSPLRDIRASGVSIVTDHTDMAHARLEFENGCVADITASRLAEQSERKMRLFSNDACITLDFGNRCAILVEKDTTFRDGPIPGARTETLSFAQADALDAELRDFVASVRSRRPPLVSGRVGRAALSVALDIMEQIASG